ncbi:hypothetical protein PINS_up020620 [Pythium insidiosum]|nr:hypothetical protein PINS_up020620 [Pythium insidiosum]
MARRTPDDTEYIWYTIVVSASSIQGVPPDTAEIKMPKFYGGTAKEWLRWSIAFKSLIKKTKWPADAAVAHLLLLLDGPLAQKVEELNTLALASGTGVSIDHFIDAIGGWFVPHNFSEMLEEEMYHLVKRREESVQSVLRRLREIVRFVANLPVNAEEVIEAKQCRFLKRAMPFEWKRKFKISGLHRDKLSDLVVYFEGLEAEEKRTRHDKRPQGKSGNQKPRHALGNKPHMKTSNSSKWCSHHHIDTHSTANCLALKRKHQH